MSKLPTREEFERLKEQLAALQLEQFRLNRQLRGDTQILDERTARLHGIRDDVDEIEEKLAPLFDDPIYWSSDFDMLGNTIDMAGGVLSSRNGWVRLQTHWDDMQVGPGATQAAGAKIPSYSQFQTDGAGSAGVYAYIFPPATERELFFSVQLPHSWIEQTEIEPHVHWSPNGTGAGNTVWGLEYTMANVGEPFPTTTTIEAISAAPEVDKRHTIAGFEPDIDMTGKLISVQIVGRIYRISGDVRDTFSPGAWFHELDFHIRHDGIGSNNVFSKSTSVGGESGAGGGSSVGSGKTGGSTPTM